MSYLKSWPRLIKYLGKIEADEAILEEKIEDERGRGSKNKVIVFGILEMEKYVLKCLQILLQKLTMCHGKEGWRR